MQSGTYATANGAPLDQVANDLSGQRGAKNASGPVGLYYTSLAQASMASAASVDSWLSKTNLMILAGAEEPAASTRCSGIQGSC